MSEHIVKHVSKSEWKRRLHRAALGLFIATGVLAVLVWSRFVFSHQDFPRLARWQRHRKPTADLNRAIPRIIGHRGSGIRATTGDSLIGNTARAIQQGIDAGADAIEIDIRRSRDGRLVVFHDETIDLKTTGEGTVAELEFDQLRSAKVLVDPPERILSLDEVFAKFGRRDRRWILDVKQSGIHKQLLQWVDQKVANGELSKKRVTIFGTFEILSDYRDCGYALGYTAVWKYVGNRLRVLFRPSELIRRCEILDCDYLVLPVIFANSSLVDAARSKGFGVWVYGTDDGLDLRQLASFGVGGLIVDHPKQAKRLFRNGSDAAVRGGE